MPRFLHVGCGAKRQDQTTAGFGRPEWVEVRLDIDPAACPDIVASITDMAAVPDGSFDALFSSHNLEHLYPHEVPAALREFHRVLGPDGFAVVTCPDLKAVARLVAEDRLADPVYVSPAGPITPLDMLYGHGASIERGNNYMAHRGGFTAKTLIAALQEAGFVRVVAKEIGGNLTLWALASKRQLSPKAAVALAKEHF
jgi:ubiquinone/menaquinone biosynthesis C-methylase UbiE